MAKAFQSSSGSGPEARFGEIDANRVTTSTMHKLWAAQQGFELMRDSPFSYWTQGECLGAGNFGKVYKCVTRDDEIFAVKVVKMEPRYTETQEEVKVLENEIRILKKLRHVRIVSYYGSEQKDGHLHLFLDFMAGGSLSAHIKKSGVLPEDESQRYINQMLQGIKFLHSQNIIHRDIKGSNVLLDGEGNVKLADFGLSKMIQKVGSKTNLVSHCGTPYWMAPEIFWGEGYGRKADIWSLGCTVVEMLTGKPPLSHLEPAAAMFRIGSRPIELTLPENVSIDAKEFVKAALTWTPAKRPLSDELQRFKFVSKVFLDADFKSSTSLLASDRHKLAEIQALVAQQPLPSWSLGDRIGAGAVGEAFLMEFLPAPVSGEVLLLDSPAGLVQRNESSVKRRTESPCISPKRPKRTLQHLEVKVGAPEKDDLEGLAMEIVAEWKELGRRLLKNEVVLYTIHHQNERLSEKAYKMLLKWKAAEGSGATFRVLHDALCHHLVNRRDLAEKYCLVKND